VSTLRDLIALLRPGQWAKNLVVLLPVLDPALQHWNTVGRAGVAVLAFTLASALIYVMNDIADRKRDRAHVTKRERPIASGRLSPWTAAAGGAALAAVLAAIVTRGSVTDWWPLLAYLALNVAYSTVLKHVPLIDLFTVATGFVLRLIQGYTAIHLRPSGWLTLCVLSVCLVLVLGKRRHELGAADSRHRPALAGYNVHFVDQLLVLTAAVTLITYQLYVNTLSPTALLTAPCALFAMFRYLQVVLVKADGGNPVRTLLRDRVMLGNAVVWILLIEGGFVGG